MKSPSVHTPVHTISFLFGDLVLVVDRAVSD